MLFRWRPCVKSDSVPRSRIRPLVLFAKNAVLGGRRQDRAQISHWNFPLNFFMKKIKGQNFSHAFFQARLFQSLILHHIEKDFGDFFPQWAISDRFIRGPFIIKKRGNIDSYFNPIWFTDYEWVGATNCWDVDVTFWLVPKWRVNFFFNFPKKNQFHSWKVKDSKGIGFFI